MNLLIKKSKFIFLCLSTLTLLVSVLAFFVLPERFFVDAKYITQQHLHGNEEIGSYGFTIAFYNNTFLSDLPFPVIAIIQFPILIYILYKIGIPKNFHHFNIKNGLVYLSFFMLAIFVSMPSKEFITFIFISSIPFLFQSKVENKYKVLSSIVFFIMFGFVFRIYFVIIPILAIGMYLISFINFKNKLLATFFYGISIAVFISLTHGMIKGVFISEMSREVVNSYRKAAEVNSMIISPVKTDVWYGETIGIFYGFFSVNLPLIEGIKHILSPQIIAFIIWQLLVFYILCIRYLRCVKNKSYNQLELWSILFVFAFFIVQGIFEPDLGTATRHKIGFLPLIYYIFYYDYFRKVPQ